MHSRPSSVSFTGKGLLGYTFGPLKQKDLEVYYVEVEKGHDFFMISKTITRVYYIVSGSGYFTINDDKYEVTSGMLVEVPPGVEYCYSGTMTLLVLSKPRWFSGNDVFTKWNTDVVRHDYSPATNKASWLKSLVRWRVLGKSPIRAYLRLNQPLWAKCPSSFTNLKPIRRYGDILHALARMEDVRAQAFSTLFLRNRPELELIQRLLDRIPHGDELKIAVLGCSTGAEAYSVAWKIRSARPDLKIILQAVDISKQAVEFAKNGVYSLAVSQLTNTQILEGVSAIEMEELFDRRGEVVAVKPWIKDGISWQVGDVGDPETIDSLGPQDMVLANNFLCHMEPAEAERCLRNISRLVRPHGHLFVSGIDLDVRTKVACDLAWLPIEELLEDIHDGDSYLRSYWPGQYAGLEPLDKRKPDWQIRYAAAFQIPPEVGAAHIQHENELCSA